MGRIPTRGGRNLPHPPVEFWRGGEISPTLLSKFEGGEEISPQGEFPPRVPSWPQKRGELVLMTTRTMMMMMVMMIMMAAPRKSFKQWSLLTICFYLLSFHQNWHQDIWRNKPRPWDIKENCSKLFRWHCLFFSSNYFNFWSKLLVYCNVSVIIFQRKW